jgi:TrmH family RNA methyltransferase
VHLLRAYQLHGGVPEVLAFSASALDDVRLMAECADLEANERVVLDDLLFAALAPVATPTGVLGIVATPAPAALPALPEHCVLLDRVQDSGNLGSILRSAAAAGVQHALLSKGCVFAWSPRVLRAAMGAHFAVAIHEHRDLAAFIGTYAGQVYATSATARSTIYQADLRGPCAWLFGNEGAGVAPDLRALCHAELGIPVVAGVESLNVAAAAAICLFERHRQISAAAAARLPAD